MTLRAGFNKFGVLHNRTQFSGLRSLVVFGEYIPLSKGHASHVV